jgi:cysteine sulfinate desulfinase/cysteine desulfurase-like protein/rhodanese-related sulfurtransferase/glyoxylase-like metal-dependent hydrolase (beta-lactamase superfamily II)
MEIYLDANATTPVLAAARAAALAAMADDFGNPSSTHSTGLKARALVDAVRATARRVLGAPGGRLLFLSGATEGIQTAVLSALTALRGATTGLTPPDLLLYGATEHKAVPEALRHWNALLGLDLQVLPIPVGRDGRHDLAWLREHAPRAGLVCTMAANNETGVVSDLAGIAAALAGSPARWMVDAVQALGKLPLQLDRAWDGRAIDYAPFSGHKLYAPKGIGLLYVREGAPFTPLMAGGGQEGAARAGTENMSGIAALGAVLAALEAGGTFASPATLQAWRAQLAAALQSAFPGLQFNAPPEACLPSTLNFSVPGLGSRLLLDVFDAAGVRVSGGSACGAAQAAPSHVLEAMGLPAWQAASAVRLSFGPAADAAFIDEACTRIHACGQALRDSGIGRATGRRAQAADGVTRLVADGDCCYLLADGASRRCVVIDPRPALADRLAQCLLSQGHTLAAVLTTRAGGPAASAAAALREALPELLADTLLDLDAFGWPEGVDRLRLGGRRLARLPLPGVAAHEACGFLLDDGHGAWLAFVGEGRFDGGAPADALRRFEQAVGRHTLLLPGRDADNHFATTLAGEAVPSVGGQAAAGAGELPPAQVPALLQAHPGAVLVDVREAYEQRLGHAPRLNGRVLACEQVPLSGLIDALPRWRALPAETPVLFFCRSGSRSAQAARALRRLGHE